MKLGERKYTQDEGPAQEPWTEAQAEMSASTWQFTEKSALKLPGLLAR